MDCHALIDFIQYHMRKYFIDGNSQLKNLKHRIRVYVYYLYMNKNSCFVPLVQHFEKNVFLSEQHSPDA